MSHRFRTVDTQVIDHNSATVRGPDGENGDYGNGEDDGAYDAAGPRDDRPEVFRKLKNIVDGEHVQSSERGVPSLSQGKSAFNKFHHSDVAKFSGRAGSSFLRCDDAEGHRLL